MLIWLPRMKDLLRGGASREEMPLCVAEVQIPKGREVFTCSPLNAHWTARHSLSSWSVIVSRHTSVPHTFSASVPSFRRSLPAGLWTGLKSAPVLAAPIPISRAWPASPSNSIRYCFNCIPLKRTKEALAFEKWSPSSSRDSSSAPRRAHPPRAQTFVPLDGIPRWPC